MDYRRCECTDEMEPCRYVINNETYEEGYLCLKCRKFTPIEDDYEDEEDFE